MLTTHPQYIKDTAGKNLVILPQNEVDTLMEELEDIRLFDEAKKTDTGERVAVEDAFKLIEKRKHA